MLTLPPIQPATLRSFTATIAVLSALIVGLVLWLSGARWPFGLAVIIASVLALPGLLWPKLARLPYRAWNKIASEFARIGRAFVSGICFYVVVVAVGRAGASIRLASPEAGESMWVPRTALAEDSVQVRPAMPASERRHGSWISAFFSWAVRSGNFWTCFLVPFLMLLSALDVEWEEKVPTDTYTLY
jgi:hypothetical protein